MHVFNWGAPHPARRQTGAGLYAFSPRPKATLPGCGLTAPIPCAFRAAPAAQNWILNISHIDSMNI
jgi:hypothetical protein